MLYLTILYYTTLYYYILYYIRALIFFSVLLINNGQIKSIQQLQADCPNGPFRESNTKHYPAVGILLILGCI